VVSDPWEKLSPHLIAGAEGARAFRAIADRLHQVFPETRFSHQVIPPRATKSQWDNLVRATPLVALAYESWSPQTSTGAQFRGDLTFALVLITKHGTARDQYLGDGVVPGIIGMSALASYALHGWTIDDVGTCQIAHSAAVQEMDWLREDLAAAGLVVRIPNVGFEDADLITELDDFLALERTMIVDGVAQTPTTLQVRDQ